MVKLESDQTHTYLNKLIPTEAFNCIIPIFRYV